jgi:hypothetical protein
MLGESQLGLAISDALAERGRGILRSEATPCGRKGCLPQWLFRSGRLCQVPKLAPASVPALSATSGTELTA